MGVLEGNRLRIDTPDGKFDAALQVLGEHNARNALAARGVKISEVFHPGAPGAQFQADGSGRVRGRAPGHTSYSSFATFSDPSPTLSICVIMSTRLIDVIISQIPPTIGFQR